MTDVAPQSEDGDPDVPLPTPDNVAGLSPDSPTSSMDVDQDACKSITLQRTAALLLLTLKEKYRLTQTAIDFVVGSV